MILIYNQLLCASDSTSTFIGNVSSSYFSFFENIQFVSFDDHISITQSNYHLYSNGINQYNGGEVETSLYCQKTVLDNN